VLSNNPNRRILVLTHVKELVGQNYAEMLEVWPNAPVGIHAEGLNRRDTVQPIIFASIQSVSSTLKKNKGAFGAFDLILIDEAHLVSPSDETQYKRTIGHFSDLNSDLRVVGLTATAYRMKHGMLTEGGLFTDFAINKTSLDDFNQFVFDGYLVPLIPTPTSTVIDVSNVKIGANGDFSSKELQEASNLESVSIGAIREMIAKGADRQKWLIFCSGIAHVESVSEILDHFGVSNVFTHSKLTSPANDLAVSSFIRDPGIRAMVNADRLTTGFNAPAVDMIGMLRATRSSTLHVQMLGRGTRPSIATGKRNCLVMDFAGNVQRLGPINDPVLPRAPGKKGAPQPAPIKYCPNCCVMNHTSVRFCIACETEFPQNVNFGVSAGSVPVMAGFDDSSTSDWDVKTVLFKKIITKSDLPAMRVSYHCGHSKTASEVVCFEHSGYPRFKAVEWWKAHHGPYPCPKTVDEAMARVGHGLQKPRRIRVVSHTDNKYPTIAHKEF